METANGLSIDEKGVVEAKQVEDGEPVEVRWGRIDDPDAGDFQDTMGVEDAEWVENDSDADGRYFIYEQDGGRLKIYQSSLNDAVQ